MSLTALRVQWGEILDEAAPGGMMRSAVNDYGLRHGQLLNYPSAGEVCSFHKVSTDGWINLFRLR